MEAARQLRHAQTLSCFGLLANRRDWQAHQFNGQSLAVVLRPTAPADSQCRAPEFAKLSLK